MAPPRTKSFRFVRIASSIAIKRPGVFKQSRPEADHPWVCEARCRARLSAAKSHEALACTARQGGVVEQAVEADSRPPQGSPINSTRQLWATTGSDNPHSIISSARVTAMSAGARDREIFPAIQRRRFKQTQSLEERLSEEPKRCETKPRCFHLARTVRSVYAKPAKQIPAHT